MLLPATTSPATSRDILLPSQAAGDTKHRIDAYCRWLETVGREWYNPDLAAYRDAMLERGLSSVSVRAHLSSVRSRYRELLRDNAFIALLYRFAREEMPAASRADHKAKVDELLRFLENAIAAENAPVEVIVVQDEADDAHLRLTAAQAEALLAAPDPSTLRGLAERAAIGLMLCTGIREAELVALDVPDVYQSYGGAAALLVRRGKRAKQRMIPYGKLAWVLDFVATWLDAAGIKSGPVFQGFVKGNRRLNGRRISTKWVDRMLAKYPIELGGGKTVIAKPHDLRRTYARRLWESGMPLEAIQQNMGHADTRRTLGYIGSLDAATRSPGAVYRTKEE